MQEAITVAVTMIVISVMLKLAQKPAKFIPADEAIVLEYSQNYARVLSALFMSPAAVFAALWAKTGTHSTADLWGYIGMILLFPGLGIFIYLKMTKEKVMAAPTGVFADTLFGTSYSFAYTDIVSVKYSRFGRKLIIESRNRKIKISRLMPGFGDFCLYISQCLSDENFRAELETARTDSAGLYS